MTPAEAFEILKRLGQVPVDPLVDALRQVHGGSGHGPLPSLLASIGAPVRPDEPAPAAAPPGDYEAARRHFVAHAQRLREQALLAERLLEGIVHHGTDDADRWQPRELAITCGSRSTAQTRFLVSNGLERAVVAQFRVGRLHGLREQPPAPLARFDPPSPLLEPGGEEVVRIGIDLRDCECPLDVLEFGIDVVGDEQLLAKLWVRVVVTPEESGDEHSAE